ncbi:hypothetical protein TNIN_92451 [Trichonephila inaurata madagascariensis]|uniref:Uncharacterized protein n=1 Tax=Trichonephila inaurata madagascariensis TaxID=2747483 RepID=A0A8X6WY28_9ARAC|nr:hypothetical protein TNIN_92451 [Trichonephila inaurata madagascariensis]
MEKKGYALLLYFSVLFVGTFYVAALADNNYCDIPRNKIPEIGLKCVFKCVNSWYFYTVNEHAKVHCSNSGWYVLGHSFANHRPYVKVDDCSEQRLRLFSANVKV